MACTSGGCGQSNSSSLKTLQAMPTSQAAPNVTALNAVTAQSNPNGLLISQWDHHSLQCPSTQYSFMEAACTTAGCQTGGVANVTTLDSAPVGQAPPSSSIPLPLPCPSNGMLPSNPTMSSLPTPCTIESPALSPSQRCGHLLQRSIPTTPAAFSSTRSTVYIVLEGGTCTSPSDVSSPLVVMATSSSITVTGGGGPQLTCWGSPDHNLQHKHPSPDGFDAVSVQNVGSTYIIVSWDLPTHSNGILINFSLYCNGALAGVLPLTVISYNTTGLLPFTLYMYMSSSHARRHCTLVGTRCWASSVLQPACPVMYMYTSRDISGKITHTIYPPSLLPPFTFTSSLSLAPSDAPVHCDSNLLSMRRTALLGDTLILSRTLMTCVFINKIINPDKSFGSSMFSANGWKHFLCKLLMLHSDQGSNLNAEVNQRLCQLLGIERSRTTAYHPQGNGQVERFNRTVEAILAKMVGEHQDDWDKHLQKAVFASLHESTGYSPYFVNFGRSPVLPVDVMLGRFGTGERGDGTIPQYIKEVKTTLKMAYDVIRENLDVAQKKRKERRDKHCAEVGETSKLSSQWRGPYTVIDRVSPVNYKIQLIGTTKTQTVHHNRMKMCHGDPEKWNSEQSNEDDPVVLPDDASFDLGFECGGVERSIGGYVGADDEIPQQPSNLSPALISTADLMAPLSRKRPKEKDETEDILACQPVRAKYDYDCIYI
ncbi:hypothetical protein EMCRGX_G018530 [Ephydatia muelleri]